MSRRRRKNPLLGRILLISVAVHVIALPILAHFGAFEKIRRAIVGPTVVVLPPPETEKEKPVEKKPEAKKAVAKAKGPSAAKEAKSRPSAPHPPVIAAANLPSSSGAAPSSAPSIDTAGTGRVGLPPSAAPGPGPAGGGSSATPASPSIQPREAPAEPKPESKPETKPAPEPAKPHVPVLAAAEPTYQPQPDLPDDLRAEAVDATTVVEIRVSPQGEADSVRVSSSSGNPELDRLAVTAAKRWKFRAATRDGEAIASTVRLHVQFKVDL